jgi:prepilin-type N-terminal cleavage/methylation domain-containing protein
MTRSTESGFGLMEVIVALAIIAVALPICYRAMGGAFRAQVRVTAHEGILFRARSQLDALGASEKLRAGTFSGSYGKGVSWRLTVTPLDGEGAGQGPAPRAYWVVLEAFEAGRRPLFKFETAKLEGKTP